MLVIITTPLVSTDPDKRVEVKMRYEGKITNLFSTRKHILIMLDEAICDATSHFKVQTFEPTKLISNKEFIFAIIVYHSCFLGQI